MTNAELLTNPFSKIDEAYRRVKINLDNKQSYKVLQITSSSKSENNVDVAYHLAKSYVEENKKVLILDLTSSRQGFSDMIVNKTTINENLVDYNGVKYLSGGSLLASLPILLQTTANLELIKDFACQFDLVIVVTSSILVSSLPLLIDKVSDGCLLVVSKMKTNKDLAKEAIISLKRSNVKLIGTIIVDNK